MLYLDYFQELQKTLHEQGNGQPQLILDLSKLEQNVDWLQHKMPTHLKPRLVVKSLANSILLKRIAKAFNTQSFMVFHLPHAVHILQAYTQADILMGKPVPLQCLKSFTEDQAEHLPKVQWLIDSAERLKNYLAYAKERNLQLRINLEIDIGLHRGGLSDLEQFMHCLAIIKSHSEYLSLSGLMGYDAHVSKLPSALFPPIQSYQKSQQCYMNFINVMCQMLPELDLSALCLNGAGSGTLHHHFIQTVCNDVSFGSMLLKPTDFDLEGLEPMQPALWIAAPVLKVLDQIQLPGLERLKRFQPRQRAVCIYGGYWRGKCIYPPGAKPHLLYGRSSNQELLQIPSSCRIQVDDYVFFRPAQSESILPQFASLYAYEQGQYQKWENFRE